MEEKMWQGNFAASPGNPITPEVFLREVVEQREAETFFLNLPGIHQEYSQQTSTAFQE
jgi:hypothetical protein